MKRAHSQYPAAFLLSMMLFTEPATGQQLLTLGDACSYYGEEIVDAVYGFASDQDAVSAVQKIVDHTGLPQNFKIMAANVPNAAADIDKEGERLILYNQTFMKRITETAQTDWAATSILAHEIGHHLSGHTLKRGGSRPEIELQADGFSGFVLFKMGARLEDAQAAMEALTNEKPSDTHPPKSARLAAIANGWTKAREQSGGTTPPSQAGNVERTVTDPETNSSQSGLQGSLPIGNSYVAQCSFNDGSALSIDQNNRLLTFIEGITLDVGFRRPSTIMNVQYELFITSQDMTIAALLAAMQVYNVTYYVDAGGIIWKTDLYGNPLAIGSCR